MIRKAFILLSVLAAASATLVLDCGSSAKVNEVLVSGCVAPPCKLVRGEDIIVEIDFKSNTHTKSLISKVHGVIGGLPVPWFGVEPDGCTTLTKGDCPIEVNESVYYKVVIPVLKEYPAVDVLVDWKLVDDAGKNIVCFNVPAKVV